MRGKMSSLAERGVAIIAGVLDEESWDAISVGAVGVAHLGSPNLYIDDESYVEYDFPVEVALGVAARALVGCYNDSDFSQYLKVTLEFIDPDGDSQGQKPTTRTFPANTVESCYSYEVTIDKPGIWKIHGTIEKA